MRTIALIAILSCLAACPAFADVAGLIVPHHLLAEPMIRTAFEGIKDSNYSKVVILGPNHRNIGQKNVAAAGDLYIDLEHSISALLPLVKEYFPRAKVVPITFKYYTPPEEAEREGKKLAAVRDGKTLVIASVDFSHHATRPAAEVNDKESIRAISSFDLGKIYSLKLDSPASIYCLLSYLKIKGADQSIMLGNATAADFSSGADPADLTSYVTCYFAGDDSVVTILATGDVMLGRAVNMRMSRKGYEFPFRKTADLLKSSDITFINLECPIVANCAATNEGMRLSADLRSVKGLQYSGVDVVNLANNHIYDHGPAGRINTLKVLNDAGFQVCDEHERAVVDIKGSRFSFLGYNCLSPRFDLEKARAGVRDASSSSDVVVVALHWGNEYTYNVSDRQRQIARVMIDSGADLIIGNHPHYVQESEVYGKGFVTYSHGNFVFDQIWSKETQEG
ncbi:MAG: AmmeMemoRadiSam system protein B, partial [Candidatus Margulisbacteria bacterium]|nr:AmmeMemoRadiSam system protein B [Candidatus Margulisiibacteriota bacterium]